MLKGVGIRKDSSQLKEEAAATAENKSPSGLHMVPMHLDDLIVGTKIDIKAAKK